MKREPKLPVVIPEKLTRWRSTAKGFWNRVERFKKWHEDTNVPVEEELEYIRKLSELLYYAVLAYELKHKRKTRDYEPPKLSE